MPSWRAWVNRPRGIIKSGGEVQTHLEDITLIKVENVS